MSPAKTTAQGQTRAERKLDIDRLEAVLQGMIIMLRDNPDVPLPWSVDFNGLLPAAEFERFVELRELETFGGGMYAYLAPIADRYSAAEDRGELYMPWSVAKQQEDRPL